LTRTNSGEECGLISGEDGPAIELVDERPLEDIVQLLRLGAEEMRANVDTGAIFHLIFREIHDYLIVLANPGKT
jgi:hypothetical protein